MGVGPRMWNTRDTPPLPERIGCVVSRTPCHFRRCHDLGQRATLDRETLDVESPIPQIFADRPEEARRNQASSIYHLGHIQISAANLPGYRTRRAGGIKQEIPSKTREYETEGPTNHDAILDLASHIIRVEILQYVANRKIRGHNRGEIALTEERCSVRSKQ